MSCASSRAIVLALPEAHNPWGAPPFIRPLKKTSTQEDVIVNVAFYLGRPHTPYCQRFWGVYPVASAVAGEHSFLSVVCPFLFIPYPVLSTGYPFLSGDACVIATPSSGRYSRLNV